MSSSERTPIFNSSEFDDSGPLWWSIVLDDDPFAVSAWNGDEAIEKAMLQYGHRPTVAHAKVASSEFQTLLADIQGEEDVMSLARWGELGWSTDLTEVPDELRREFEQ